MKVMRIGKWLAMAAVFMLLVPGCEFVEEHEKASIGVGAGAVGGAAIGGLSGGRKGAVIGGLIGALAGGAIGAYLDHKDKTAEETQKAYSYKPEQGLRLELNNVSVEPKAVAAGGEIRVQATYAVMTPDPQQQVVVRETRVITLAGAKVADAAVEVNRTGGTYTSEVPITLPGASAKGAYQAQVTVETAGQSRTFGTSFTVN